MKNLLIKTVTALGLATVALSAITPALADWNDHGRENGRGREWRERQGRENDWRERGAWRERQEWRAREWREHHRGWYGYGPYGRGYYDGPVYRRNNGYYGPGVELRINTGR